jgi:hypothetical protein
MISILVTLLIIVLVVGIVFWILSLLPIPQPWLNVARAILGLIVLIWLISYLLPLAGHPALLR